MPSVIAWSALLLGVTVACGPSSVPRPKPVARSLPVATPPLPDTLLGSAIDTYVAGFGRTWGEAFGFSGYVAVARDGQIVFGKGYGKADREKGIVAGPDTRFRIGSTTKSFTAIGIMQLEERELLRLEDPIRKYLPELPSMAAPVTIHHCLTHTSGLPPLADDEALVAETGQRHAVTAAFASYKDKALMFAPGERFQYSNAGYTVLAAILERVTGQSYDAYMREHVFGPAGMARTTTVSRPSPPSDMAVGYDLDARGNLSVAKDPWYVVFGSGAILSTANDLVAFDRALSGTLLLRDGSKRRMFTPERDVGGIVQIPSRYGLGWLISNDAGHEVLWHPGGVNGFEANFARVPDVKLTVVVLSNRFGDTGLTTKVAQAARHVALGAKAPPPEDEPEAGPLDAKLLNTLAGDYRIDAPSRAAMQVKFTPDVVEGRSGLIVTAEDGHLLMSWIRQSGPEVFQAPNGMITKQNDLRVTVEPDAAGRAGAIILTPAHPEGRITLRYERLGTAINPPPTASCPAGMQRLPGGTLGADHGSSIASFCMDTTEVTVGAYADCARSGRCRPAPTTAQFEGMTAELAAKWNPACNGARKDRLDHPANCVDWEQSAAYCRAQGKRLPTENEWQWAARGGEEERVYPWGYRAPSAQLCWSGITKRDSTCPVAAFAEGDALGGVHDLAGNVGEWTSTTAPGGHVIKAAGWNIRDPAMARTDSSEIGLPIFRGPSTGFRCAK